MDDVATMEVSSRQITTDTISSKLVYFVKGGAISGDTVAWKGDSGDREPTGSRGPTGKRGAKGPEGPLRPARGGIGARGGNGDSGDTAGVGQQGPIGLQCSTGPRGTQGAAGKSGPKGDMGAPAVEIDIVAQLCKHLPIAIVEQYRRGAYDRYAINSMGRVELHDVARVKTIIDKGGRCNASQNDVTRMATLSQTRVNSNYVLNFHNDTYNLEADMPDFHYFSVFLVYEIKAYAKFEHWERNYLISNWSGGTETKYSRTSAATCGHL